MYYPATLTPYADGSGRYGVSFVDLPGCVSIGENLEDALQMASEALSLHLALMMAEGCPIPPPSTIEDAESRERENALKNNIPLAMGTQYRIVQFEPEQKREEERYIRVTISLKTGILEMIDNKARKMGVSRSGFISLACREYRNDNYIQ